jgi:hypothetical protein
MPDGCADVIFVPLAITWGPHVLGHMQAITWGSHVFWRMQGKSEVEYRSASRVGESDFDINRKRIRDIRKALEPKGWKSVGF